MNYVHHYAIIPFYGEDGSNRTMVIYSDGTKEVMTMPIKSYLYTIYSHVHLDPKLLQFWTTKILGSKCNCPITLTNKCIFIPIKMRQAFGKSDGCFGYVLSQAIETVDDYSLTLKGEISLTTLSPKSYVSKKLRDAKLLAYAYTDERKQYEFMLH